MDRTPAEERALQIHMARVSINEAKNRRGSPGFHCWMLDMAARARLKAAAIRVTVQPDLFG